MKILGFPDVWIHRETLVQHSRTESEKLKVILNRLSRGLAKAREGLHEVTQLEADVELLLDKLFYGKANDGRAWPGTTRNGRVPRRILGRIVLLTNQMASIFDILAKADDWVNPDELAGALEKQTGKLSTRRTLRQSLYRIRREFEIRNVPPSALQSSRRGYRLNPATRRDDS